MQGSNSLIHFGKPQHTGFKPVAIGMLTTAHIHWEELPSPAEFTPSQGDWFPEPNLCFEVHMDISSQYLSTSDSSSDTFQPESWQSVFPRTFQHCLLAHRVALDFPDPCPTPVGQGAGDSKLSSTLIITFDVESYKKNNPVNNIKMKAIVSLSHAGSLTRLLSQRQTVGFQHSSRFVFVNKLLKLSQKDETYCKHLF